MKLIARISRTLFPLLMLIYFLGLGAFVASWADGTGYHPHPSFNWLHSTSMYVGMVCVSFVYVFTFITLIMWSDKR